MERFGCSLGKLVYLRYKSNPALKVAFWFNKGAIRDYIHNYGLQKGYKNNHDPYLPSVEDFKKSFFITVHFGHFYSALKEALNILEASYKDIGLLLKSIKEVNILFVNKGTASIQNKEDFSTVDMWFNINNIDRSTNEIFKTLIHELYHLISDLHENQAEMVMIFEQSADRIEYLVKKDREKMEKSFAKFAHNLRLEKYEHIDYRLVQEAISIFYSWSERGFGNYVADMALNIIAIELNDTHYLDYQIKQAEKSIQDISDQTKEFPLMIKHAKKQDRNERSQNTINTIKLFQFIYAFTTLPFDIIPIARLGEQYWVKRRIPEFLRLKTTRKKEAKKLLKEFNGYLEMYCDREVWKDYLEFFNALSKIVDKSKIHNNPLNPDILEQIHNSASQHQAIKAQGVLRRIHFKYLSHIKLR